VAGDVQPPKPKGANMRKPKIPKVPLGAATRHSPDDCLVCAAGRKSHPKAPVEMAPRPRHATPGEARSGDYSGRHRTYDGRHRRGK
jgi:hypothetical protein